MHASVKLDVCLAPQQMFSRLFGRTVVLLAGPTGAGKTAVSLELAPMIDGEIISVDSMQVYRDMDIGTAKVAKNVREVVPHHLIDICHVQETFSAVDFYYQATQACHNILNRNKIPILVGGSGFYFHTFLSGPPEGPSPDYELRGQLAEYAAELGITALYQELSERDPVYAQTITKHDKNKIIRALEIIHISGKKVSDHTWNSTVHGSQEYDCLGWFLSPPKDVLCDTIEGRCEQMLASGLVDEVCCLMDQGLLENPSASKAIGYREWIPFIERGYPDSLYETTKAQFISNSIKYVKKQRTWFKRYPIFRTVSTLGLSARAIAEQIAVEVKHA